MPSRATPIIKIRPPMASGMPRLRAKPVIGCTILLVLLCASISISRIYWIERGSKPNPPNPTEFGSASVLQHLTANEQPGLNHFCAAMQRQIVSGNDTFHALPTAATVPAPTPAEAGEMARTSERFYQLFGHGRLESYFGAGIETGNPVPKNLGEQWNSLRDSGLYDAA